MGPDDWNQFEEVHPATAALARLQEEGAQVTNGYRTPDDTQRLRNLGYTAATHSAHLEGDAVDLVPGGRFKSLGQLRAFAAREFGPDATVQIHNGTHVHVAISGWHDAPDTTRSNEWDEFKTVAPAPTPEPQSNDSSPLGPHAPASATGQVHDGDTFRLSSGDNARLFGADAFELNQQGRRPDQALEPLGMEARDYLAGHLPSGSVDFTGQSTYGRPVVAADQSAEGLLRNGLGLAEPQYLKGDPRFSQYMEAERLARQNRLGGHGTNAETPAQFRHGDGPWASAQPGVYGQNSEVVFSDEPIPFQGLRPEIEKGYIQLADNPKSTADDLMKYASDNGFIIRRGDAEKFVALRNKGGTPSGQATYEMAPKPVTNVGDGMGGSFARGFADPINVLDELGGLADTVVPVPDFDGPRENIWNSDRRFGDIYANNVAQNRAVLAYDEEQHPYARFGGQLTSGLAIPGASVEGVGARATAKALEKGASEFAADIAAKRAVAQRLGTVGAIEGGAAGAGGGEDTQSRLTGAALGAAGGAAIGVAAPPVLDAVGSLAKRAVGAFRRGEEAAPEVAARAAAREQAPVEEAPATSPRTLQEILREPRPDGSPKTIREAQAELEQEQRAANPTLDAVLQGEPVEVHLNAPDGSKRLTVTIQPKKLTEGINAGQDGFEVVNGSSVSFVPRSLMPSFLREYEGDLAGPIARETADNFSKAAEVDGMRVADESTRYANMEAEQGPSIESEPLQTRSASAGRLSDGEMGRAPFHDIGPQPEDFAPAASRMNPEDVTPIPDNRVGSMEEAAQANPGRFVDAVAPDEMDALRVRTLTTRKGGRVKYRGPLDAVAFIRHGGGIKGSAADLAHLGITNAPRDFNRQEWRLGPMLNSKGGMTLDEAGEKLWEAGYLSHRPTMAEVLDILQNGEHGKLLYHPEDTAELARFHEAQAERGRIETADPPLAEERGAPATLEDRLANRPPITAYEDLPGLVDKVGNINLKNINNAADISRAMKHLEDEFGMGQPSPVSHAETEALAREMGMSAKELLASREGRAFNHAEATAARALLAKSYQEMLDLAKRAMNGTDEDKLLFQKAVANVAAIHNKVAGLTREAGRALSAFRIPVDHKTLSGKALKELLDANGGAKNIDKLAEGILDLERAGNTPGGIARFAVEAVKPKWHDKLLALWMFALLSGPKTHAVNIVSNTLTALGQIPEYAVAAGLGAVRMVAGEARRGELSLRMTPEKAAARSEADRVLFSELGPRAFGLLQGAKEGLISAKSALKTGETSDSMSKLEMSRQQEAFSGPIGHVVHAPTRLLSAEDEFFKSIARRMEVNALAVRQARSEGLKGSALEGRIAELSANPTEEMTDKAFDYARYLTFQRPLGEKGQALMNLVGKSKLLRIPLPFVRTPTNLLKFAIERSPAAPLMKEVREDFKAGGARRDLALAKIMLGSGFGLAISEMASRGFITGSGPADENTVRQLRTDGWQPYSMKLGDKYVSYQRLDPLATTMGVFADYVDLQSAMTQKQRDHIGTLLTASIIQNLGNKTWLSGLADAFEVYSDPQRRSGPYLNRLAASVVPAGIAQVTQVSDPTLREARTMLDAIKARVPGESSTLLPKRDAYGRPIVREGGLGPDIISPFAISTRKHDPVVQAVISSGAHIDAPNRQIRGRMLNDQEFDRYQELSGKYMYGDIAERIREGDWRGLGQDDQRLEIEAIKKNARADARYDLFGDTSDE